MKDSFINEREDGFKYQIYYFNDYEFAGICVFVDLSPVDETIWKNGNKEYYVKNGVVHFLEHLIYKQIISSAKIKFGYDSFACTNLNGTYYHFTCKKENCVRMLEIIFSTLENFEIKDYVLESERHLIKDEILHRSECTNILALNKLRYGLFGNSSLSNSITGTIDNVNDITKDDLIKTFNLFYIPRKISVAIAGDLDNSRILNKLDKVLIFKEDMDLSINEIEYKLHPFLDVQKIKIINSSKQYYIGFINKSYSGDSIGKLQTKVSMEIIYNMLIYNPHYFDELISFGYCFGKKFAYGYLSIEDIDIKNFINNIRLEINKFSHNFDVNLFKECRIKAINQHLEKQRQIGTLIYMGSWLSSMNVKTKEYINLISTITEDNLKDIIKKCFQLDNLSILEIY